MDRWHGACRLQNVLVRTGLLSPCLLEVSRGQSFSTHRTLCRDAITPTQDWIISPHPRAPGLYVATGGSFHAWKFLPNIGRYVVQMLKGELREDYARRWSWDRAGDGGGNCESYIPARDLKDIHGYN